MTDFTSEGKRGFRVWNAICCVLPRFLSRENRRESAIPSNEDTPNTSDRAFLLMGYIEFLMVISMVVVESCWWLLMVLGCRDLLMDSVMVGCRLLFCVSCCCLVVLGGVELLMDFSKVGWIFL